MYIMEYGGNTVLNINKLGWILKIKPEKAVQSIIIINDRLTSDQYAGIYHINMSRS